MIKLGVNIDHVASIRQLRRGTEPNPVDAARMCEKAGANSIVVHLREDRRHINDADVAALRESIRSKLNLEMSINPDIVAVACSVKPNQATLVPEKREELTTEGGLDVIGNFKDIRAAVEKLHANDIPVSLFIDPDKKQIRAAKETGAKLIELHTGTFANADSAKEQAYCLGLIKDATMQARSFGMKVFAGHGLDYNNILVIRKIKEIEEYNIGYSIICRALVVGLERAVHEMRTRIKEGKYNG
jgi:pyridoxine 5-phosphate synthase